MTNLFLSNLGLIVILSIFLLLCFMLSSIPLNKVMLNHAINDCDHNVYHAKHHNHDEGKSREGRGKENGPEGENTETTNDRGGEGGGLEEDAEVFDLEFNFK